MSRKQRLTLWEDTFSSRQNEPGNPRQLVQILAQGAIRLAEHPDLKLSLLVAVRKGKRATLLWLLGWLQRLFGLVRLTLTKRQRYPH